MNKEMNFEAKDCVEEVMDVCEVSEELGVRKIGKKIGVGLCLTAIATGVVVMIRKNRERFDKLAKKRLVKRGYTVVEPFDEIDCSEPNSNEVETKEN